MKKPSIRVVSILMLFILLGVGAGLYIKTALHGFSARAEPSRAEALLADYARATAMPTWANAAKNPIDASTEIRAEALAHYADHCSVCHANNGSGKTMLGEGMYPKPPDLRSAHTQNLSDGELFYIIENGIRMSGMPAFGGADSAMDSWKLVHFIRHLPRLTQQEEARMAALNPKSPKELQEEKEEEQFLNGGDSSAQTTTMDHSKGHAP